MFLLHLILTGVALLVTLYVGVIARNPHEQGSDPWRSLRQARIGWALVWWGLGFGLIGIVFHITAFVLAIKAMVGGHGGYGVLVLVGTIIGTFLNIAL